VCVAELADTHQSGSDIDAGDLMEKEPAPKDEQEITSKPNDNISS
jgi:hypothetical protein